MMHNRCILAPTKRLYTCSSMQQQKYMHTCTGYGGLAWMCRVYYNNNYIIVLVSYRISESRKTACMLPVFSNLCWYRLRYQPSHL